MKSFMVWNLA